MDKFKKWFFTSDEDGLSPFDATCAFIINLLAWTLFILFGRGIL